LSDRADKILVMGGLNMVDEVIDQINTLLNQPTLYYCQASMQMRCYV
jgi:hypothetical protein